MILWLTVILFVVSLVVAVKTTRNYEPWVEVLNFISAALAFIFGVAMVIEIVVATCNHSNINSYIARMNERHDMLVYQLENNIYDNENDLGKRELMVDIQNWNEDLAGKRESQDDLWVGIFTPNIYDQFEFIELED